MQEDYGGYARRRKKPGIGRYPMGPTNIDRVDIGSCLWHPTFVVDTDGGRRLRESTRMKMVTQVKRCKIAYAQVSQHYGGYAGRLWRLCGKIRLCLCICVPYSFLNSYYHKLSENAWVGGSGASRSGEKKKKS